MVERRTRRSIGARLRPLLPLGALWLAGSTLLGLLIGQRAVPADALLLDPGASGGLPWYAGMVSSLGILGWTTGSVAAAGGAWLARIGARTPVANMLRGGSLLSVLLLLDDLFQLHIVVTKTLGSPKLAFYLLYVGLGGWWALANWREVARTRWPLLVAAGLALAASAAVDQAGSSIASVTGVALIGAGPALEDSLKFLGILAWAQYFVLTSTDVTRSIVTDERVVAKVAGDKNAAMTTRSNAMRQ